MASTNLKSSIKRLRRQDAQGKFYVPNLSFRSLITSEIVYAELKKAEIEPSLLEDLTKGIIADGRKVLAILILIEQVQLVQDFMECYPRPDYRLPLLFDQLNSFDENRVGSMIAFSFHETQWQFLVPQFTQSMISKLIPSKSALPFSKDEEIGNGGFGTIYEIRLDLHH